MDKSVIIKIGREHWAWEGECEEIKDIIHLVHRRMAKLTEDGKVKHEHYT